jgi:chromosome partitioning protein
MAKKRRGKVVTFSTLKGGSGKSTAAFVVAARLHLDGARVAIIDADPQGSIVAMGEPDGPLAGLSVIHDYSDAVGAAIERAASAADIVIVDTPGFRNRTTIAALAAADLVVVPVKPSPVDLRVAAQTVELVDEISATEERAGRPIEVRLLLTMTTPGSVIGRHMRAEIVAAGFPLLMAELANRVVYGEAALAGAPPSVTEPDGAAARDIAAVAQELHAIIRAS